MTSRIEALHRLPFSFLVVLLVPRSDLCKRSGFRGPPRGLPTLQAATLAAFVPRQWWLPSTREKCQESKPGNASSRLMGCQCFADSASFAIFRICASMSARCFLFFFFYFCPVTFFLVVAAVIVCGRPWQQLGFELPPLKLCVRERLCNKFTVLLKLSYFYGGLVYAAHSFAAHSVCGPLV